MHRWGDLKGIVPVSPGMKMVGTAVTVRTYPGDFAKPVEAIDVAQKGQVIVVDAGGAPPAIWGELATHSCLQKGVGGVVVHGAIRDTVEIRKMGFPAFSKLITPTAGEPKGFGEIGIALSIEGVLIRPGDWIVGDDDGVVVIPRAKAVEIANRAMDVLEKENRIRKEIDAGSTLAKVTELLRWEKK
jgi:3-hexulose-6-phosphate synthase/6-phospho-3-hexuloisomerase